MTPLPMPLSLPLWELASLETTQEELFGRLGEPHYIEFDSTRTTGGEEDAWAYQLSSGQRVLVIFQVLYRRARLIADPPEIRAVLRVLGIAPGEARLSCYAEPFPLD